MTARKAPPPRIVPATPAWVALTDALATLPAPTPCSGSDDWTADDAGARAAAAVACRACPVVERCAAAAASTGEAFGVWGGIDRETTKQRGKRTA